MWVVINILFFCKIFFWQNIDFWIFYIILNLFIIIIYETMIECINANIWEEEKMAVAKFKKLRLKKEWIMCPVLWIPVKFTDENFKHLTYKDKKHKRTAQEIKMRSLCFLSVDKIIKKSNTFQEYLCEQRELIIKKHGVKEKKFRNVEYIWLVAIIDSNKWKHRIRVVLKKIDWYSFAEYLSVMPARKMKWHQNFMWWKF